MAKSNDIIKRFESLPITQRRKLLFKLYKFSKETEMLFKTMLGYLVDASSLIDEMKKETLNKVNRRRMPSGVKVNSIISKAKKAMVSDNDLLILEELAFKGFVEFLNEFGGGPDSYPTMAGKHLGEHLKYIKLTTSDKTEQSKYFDKIKKYLLKNNNMLLDYVNESFELVTGEKIKRY